MDEYIALVEKITKLVKETIQQLQENPSQVHLEISARHIHLSKEHVELLFGKGYYLTPKKYLSQPGQYAAEEMLEVIARNGKNLKLRVLGPERPQTQVEISLSEGRTLGIIPPVRSSGDLAGTPGIKLRGPKGEVEISEGVIIADRHIHMTTEDAKWYGVQNGQRISVEIDGPKGGVMHNVLIRVTQTSNLDCHVDTDDANAFQLRQGQYITILK